VTPVVRHPSPEQALARAAPAGTAVVPGSLRARPAEGPAARARHRHGEIA
jgi:hypothetical protein